MTHITYVGSGKFTAHEMPEAPIKSFEAAHYVSAEQEYLQAVAEYESAKALAIENGVEVESVEPFGIYCIEELGQYYKFDKLIDPGDSFPLVGFRVEQYKKFYFYEEDDKEWKNCTGRAYSDFFDEKRRIKEIKLARLVPIEREVSAKNSRTEPSVSLPGEESQDALWDDLMKEWYDVSMNLQSPHILPYLKSKFTITRKKP